MFGHYPTADFRCFESNTKRIQIQSFGVPRVFSHTSQLGSVTEPNNLLRYLKTIPLLACSLFCSPGSISKSFFLQDFCMLREFYSN